ncbi:hypothetical protein CKAN_01510000 [Cinnamomum micranthum f. kanehirae]|uniref:Uncharacterized protein n=1 Tax=Cinnamomum micranthum f. kanehirae TaxID=337451 RepID=A0A3S4P6B6_9MAGN|nr:hypothetical protein CKAN_01510000 [Cinnamomum micranthum f. kanehirae]
MDHQRVPITTNLVGHQSSEPPQPPMITIISVWTPRASHLQFQASLFDQDNASLADCIREWLLLPSNSSESFQGFVTNIQSGCKPLPSSSLSGR